jgi:bifunctional DNA-binding transcriptional regulator/antitoxin component of YhaV-PrlF toxin-antitoxin module
MRAYLGLDGADAMNVIVKMGGVVTLPGEVLDELDLEPGSEIVFSRSPTGGFVVEKATLGERPSREQIRNQLRAAAVAARTGMIPEYADMTTDEYMELIRG